MGLWGVWGLWGWELKRKEGQAWGETAQLKILGGAPEDYRGERWATGDYSGRLGEEAHSSICPLIPPDKILTGDLWWELLRGPQWGKTNSGPRKIFTQGAAEESYPSKPTPALYIPTY